ncbi:hypothetical protein EKO04_001970 [Ascochyta lentis]|uniref:Uncharacterized protein n=1 Tax=Ascochyta lentis TaxID=205686 RepID=A0A8H7MLJ2_9PLEO|nr:hypothetical protein EKO04_001970 [Ascochyta lentis]
MHVYAIAAALCAVLSTGSTADRNILSALAPHTPTLIARPTPPAVQSHIQDGLELRQAPGLVPIATLTTETVAPEVPIAVLPAPANPPAAIPPAPAPPAANPPGVLAQAPATTTSPLLPLITGDDFVTVQWIETHIGTLRTWIPKTQTFHFESMSQAPLPGVGSIGMGTLTGKTGQTQTVYMVVGAAATLTADLKKGIAAAVAVGVAGLVV